ncbi:MAG: lamin tail domain-containing protein [Chloroflexi bacterium]|nr:MAG: lamin tail domain-containing protein [Chloroflexota bacterium]
MNTFLSKTICAAIIAAMLLGLLPSQISAAKAASDSIVISQVYGGGGNSGAVYKNDFVELFNRGAVAVDITGWSLQYASATGSSWEKANLVGTIQPGKYYLIQLAAGSGGTKNLPTPEATGSLAMNSSSAKIALVTNQILLTCGNSTNDCFPNPAIKDFIGYGTADNHEGAAAAGALSNVAAALRNGSGCADSDRNKSDFYASSPNPRNSASTTVYCALLKKMTLRSNGAYDGWILESSETSKRGGLLDAISATIFIGDDAMDRQYLALLHFTAKLPAKAVITSISLKIKKQGVAGANPFQTHGSLLVDIRKPYFGANADLLLPDFQARARKTSAAQVGDIPTSGWHTASFPAEVFPYINLAGTTQFRLRFANDDNDDKGADYMKFYSGNAGINTQPMLVIEYYVP